MPYPTGPKHSHSTQAQIQLAFRPLPVVRHAINGPAASQLYNLGAPPTKRVQHQRRLYFAPGYLLHAANKNTAGEWPGGPVVLDGTSI